MMRKLLKIVACGLSAVAVCGTGTAKADSLKDLLNGKLGQTIGNVVGETVAQNTTIDLADLEGEWKTTGPAVVLKSDNVLEQAGGAAVTSTVEEKLKTYYDKLGISNTTMKFDAEGNFTLTIKKLPVKGKLTKDENGEFSIQLLSGVSKLAKSDRTMTAYVQKAGNSMSITADVKKLLEIAEKVASKADSSTINTALKMLESYDHVCLGFRLTK